MMLPNSRQTLYMHVIYVISSTICIQKDMSGFVAPTKVIVACGFLGDLKRVVKYHQLVWLL